MYNATLYERRDHAVAGWRSEHSHVNVVKVCVCTLRCVSLCARLYVGLNPFSVAVRHFDTQSMCVFVRTITFEI